MDISLKTPAAELRPAKASSNLATRVAAAQLAALVIGISAESASAECKDAPAPGVDWVECQKTRLMLGGSELSSGNFTQTFFTSSDLRGADLSGANLTRAELSHSSLAGADLSGANMEKAVATRADFSGANLSNANLSAAEFSRTSFTGATMTGVNFVDAEMNRSDFTGADLTGADMAKVELARVILTDAVISGVSFSYSNLSRADLRGTDLGDADLTGTYMFLTQVSGADLSATKGLTADQLEIACGSDETLLPEGLTVPQTWPCPDYGE